MQNNRACLCQLNWAGIWLAFLFCTYIFSTRTFVCNKRSGAKTLGSINAKFSISAAVYGPGKWKTGKSWNHHFSGNKSPGKYTRYTISITQCYQTEWFFLSHLDATWFIFTQHFVVKYMRFLKMSVGEWSFQLSVTFE